MATVFYGIFPKVFASHSSQMCIHAICIIRTQHRFKCHVYYDNQRRRRRRHQQQQQSTAVAIKIAIATIAINIFSGEIFQQQQKKKRKKETATITTEMWWFCKDLTLIYIADLFVKIK